MTIKDGDWTLFSWDAQTGRSVWSIFDGEKTHFRVDYPVDNLISQNEQTRNSAEKAWTGDWHRVASVPLNVFYDSGLAEAQNQGDRKFVSRFLNDGDNRAWRTREGNV
jgi:acyl carrier protein phosphodiesterase